MVLDVACVLTLLHVWRRIGLLGGLQVRPSTGAQNWHKGKMPPALVNPYCLYHKLARPKMKELLFLSFVCPSRPDSKGDRPRARAGSFASETRKRAHSGVSESSNPHVDAGDLTSGAAAKAATTSVGDHPSSTADAQPLSLSSSVTSSAPDPSTSLGAPAEEVRMEAEPIISRPIAKTRSALSVVAAATAAAVAPLVAIPQSGSEKLRPWLDTQASVAFALLRIVANNSHFFLVLVSAQAPGRERRSPVGYGIPPPLCARAPSCRRYCSKPSL